ncbi:MAG: hypothetical protein O3A19_10785 [Planctomycetota bacterium]|nr:hypothetical protein [Planctomycetota bacterium]MDA1026896.1 hypothetical protein [Planctomycetota bacterium]
MTNMTMTSRKDIVSALDRGLNDLEGLLDDSVTNETYALNPVPGFTSGIGPHVRHCLDHIESLLQAAKSGAVIDYDRRKRGTPEETNRTAGINRLRTLRSRLCAATFPSDETTCDICIMLASDDPPKLIKSSWSREIMSVFQHTLHHLALLASIARACGDEPSTQIGIVPSTLVEGVRPCAR